MRSTIIFDGLAIFKTIAYEKKRDGCCHIVGQLGMVGS